MNIIDGILLIFIVAFITSGWRSGFVRAAGSFTAFVVSIVASVYAVQFLHNMFGLSFASNPWMTIIGFIAIVGIVNSLAHYIVELLDVVRKVIAIIPLVNFTNSVLGALFGLLQSGVLVLFVAYAAVIFMPDGNFRSSVLDSAIIQRAVTVETAAGLL